MKCSKAVNLLNMYIDKELPARKAAMIERHLAVCKTCRNTLRELAGVKNLIQSAPEYIANSSLWTHIAGRLAKYPIPPIWLIFAKILKIWIPVSCGLIIISSFILGQTIKAESSMYKKPLSIQKEILEIPDTPQNMEKIGLNMLIYDNIKMGGNYALF